MHKEILWIDDDESLLDSSIPVFLKNGFRVTKATTSARALKLLDRQQFDGVLLDKRLSGDEDGLDLLDVFQKHHPKLPVVLFTAFPEYDEQLLVREHGASAYFKKMDKSIPFDPEKQQRFFRALHIAFNTPSFEQSVSTDSDRRDRPGSYMRQWVAGFWSVAILAVVVFSVTLLVKKTPAYILPISIASCLILYVLVSAFFLRISGILTDKSYSQIIFHSLKELRFTLRKQEKEKPE